GQALFVPDVRAPYVSTTSALEASNGASCTPDGGPHVSSPHAEARARRLVLERKSKRCMGVHRVAEPVILDDVLEDALETRACPASFEAEHVTEDAKLCLHEVAVERTHLRVVRQVLGHRVAVAALPEERRVLRVVAIAKRRVDAVADVLD